MDAQHQQVIMGWSTGSMPRTHVLMDITSYTQMASSIVIEHASMLPHSPTYGSVTANDMIFLPVMISRATLSLHGIA